MTMFQPHVSQFVSIACLAASSSAFADRFEVDVASSAASVLFEFSVPFSGTLTGDYDPKTNPDGTQSRPGLFGGSGNNPIPCALDLSIASGGEPSSPSGTIDLDFAGIEASLLEIEAFDIDLLGESVQTVDGELALVYDTFNTINPFSIYPGGIEIPVPLAGAEVLRSEVSLLEPFTVFAAGSKGTIQFDAVIPVVWTIEFDAGTGPQTQEVPVALPLAGTISGAPGSRVVEFGGDTTGSGSQPIDVPVGPIPVPLPTIPPGNTANLLFSGALTSVDFSTDFALTIRADEIATAVFGDLDGDRRVGSSDLGILISFWGECPGCAADLNGDGRVDAMDLGELFAAWST